MSEHMLKLASLLFNYYHKNALIEGNIKKTKAYFFRLHPTMLSL